MKRKIGIGIALALALVLVLNLSVLANWIGSIGADVQVKNPVHMTEVLVPVPVSIYPGEIFGFSGEIYNESPLTYGIYLQGFIFFWWMSDEEEVMAEIALEDIKGGELSFSRPGGGPPDHLGTIEIYIDRLLYLPGSVINIYPGQTMEVKVVVNTSHSAPTGKLSARVFSHRQAPTG